MMPSDRSSSPIDHKRRMELSIEHQVRVEMPPRPCVVDVMPFCGPAGDSVRVEWYELTHCAFLSPASALAIANALRAAAVATVNPPEDLHDVAS